MNYSYLPYALVDFYCAVFAVIVLFRMDWNIGTEHEILELRRMIYSYLIFLGTDIIWAFMEGNLLYLPVWLNGLASALCVMAVTCGCYFWFKYIEARLRFDSPSRKLMDRMLIIPLLLIMATDLLSVRTGWFFIIDEENHYQNLPLFNIQSAVNYLYLLLSTGYAAYKAVKTHSRQERSEYRAYACYMLLPLAASLLQDTFPDVPLLALNIFMMILILFLMLQNMQIYHDALTGLNNRHYLNQYLESSLQHASESRPFYLFIMDINNFKMINDVYGHIEGDHALQAVSGVLRGLAAKYNAFAARYGGDEFCIVLNTPGCSPEEVCADIHTHMQEIRDGKNVPGSRQYMLSVSIGYTACDGTVQDYGQVIAAADAMLYVNKKKWHGEYTPA